MAENNFQPSFLSNLLQETSFDEGSEEEMVVKWSAASLYAGGADTTVSTMASFFLSMAMNPEVQEKAQAEIDRIVGVDRLPGYEDRDNLPYINAMVKEVFRWHPVVPTSVAHTSIKDDTCEGYHIPKGSAIIPNIWAYTHDPEVYPDPLAFKPERFLEYDGHVPERDPHLLSFGFGRRVCPGRTLADSNVYLSLAQSLAVFRITKPVRDGKVIEPEPMFQPGIISHPAPFEVDVKPRSPGHVELILAVEKEQPWEKSHAKELSSSG
ncbi:hypothetical protein EYZ11_007583 [Aspergillus tanneri]|nr:hypothetical protein EYZ11_007583 [Aspergillus tanneri]